MKAADAIDWVDADDHFEYGFAGPVGVMRRTEGTRPAPEALLECYARGAELGRERGELAGLLIDTRASRGRSGADFERAIDEGQRILLESYPRLVVLVRTQIGQMQARRLAGDHAADDHIVVTSDEELAWSLARNCRP